MIFKKQKSFAGKKGDKIRSDLFIEIELTKSKNKELDIKSKVDSLYGENIKNLLSEMIDFYGLENYKITIEDYGALPFVIAARFETAIKRLEPDTMKEFLLPMKSNKFISSSDRLRRSRLYLPGNEPKFYLNAGLHSPDGIILDLEDSVSPDEKDAAQILVRNTLRDVNFYDCERMVRINQIPKGLDDLRFIVPNNVNLILIPKCESAEQVNLVEKEIEKIKSEYKISDTIYLMPIIESALGVIKSFEIASASKNIVALTIGLEDYTADIGTQRTEEGIESFFARSMIVNVAKALGILAIDSVYSDIDNIDGLRKSVIESKQLGFEGKGCIHPKQIKVIHDTFKPSKGEIEKAEKIVQAFEDAKSKNLGVVALGSKMIDAPVVKRAIKVIELSKLFN